MKNENKEQALKDAISNSRIILEEQLKEYEKFYKKFRGSSSEIEDHLFDVETDQKNLIKGTTISKLEKILNLLPNKNLTHGELQRLNEIYSSIDNELRRMAWDDANDHNKKFLGPSGAALLIIGSFFIGAIGLPGIIFLGGVIITNLPVICGISIVGGIGFAALQIDDKYFSEKFGPKVKLENLTKFLEINIRPIAEKYLKEEVNGEIKEIATDVGKAEILPSVQSNQAQNSRADETYRQ